jgi:hypothetical protein
MGGVINRTTDRIGEYNVIHTTKHKPHMAQLFLAANNTFRTADMDGDEQMDQQESVSLLLTLTIHHPI